MVKKINSETEKKIKQAAKEIFFKKGYNWARTREITEKAWVNLALLNYYFWGKEELFNIVMIEALEEFKSKMFSLLNDPSTWFEEKVKGFANEYLSSFIVSPWLLPFILESVREHIDIMQEKIKQDNSVLPDTLFAKQYIQTTWKTIDDFKEFFINFLGLVIFPVLWAPVITAFFELNDNQYAEYIQKRKEIVPWLALKLL